MNKKRIIHVLSSRNLWGAERVALDICNSLLNNYEFMYVSLSGQIEKELLKHGTNHILIKSMNPFALYRIFKKFNPDIIHAHDNKASLASYIAGLCRKRKIVLVSHIHNAYPFLKRRGFKKLIDYLIRPHYTANIFCSLSVKKYYKKNASYYKRLAEKKVLQNFTNAKQNRANAEKFGKMQNGGMFRVGFVGRLEYQKGIDAFLSALIEQNDNKLNCVIHIVGDGSLRKSLINHFSRINIRFEGYTNNPTGWMKFFDVFILPSRFEGLPLTVLESMSVGTPVLAMDVGAVGDIIEDGTNGWVVKAGNYSGFVKKMLNLCTDKSKIEKVGLAAIATIEKKYDKKIFMKAIDEYYMELIRKRSVML